jgi:hypothetical protein
LGGKYLFLAIARLPAYLKVSTLLNVAVIFSLDLHTRLNAYESMSSVVNIAHTLSSCLHWNADYLSGDKQSNFHFIISIVTG